MAAYEITPLGYLECDNTALLCSICFDKQVCLSKAACFKRIQTSTVQHAHMQTKDCLIQITYPDSNVHVNTLSPVQSTLWHMIWTVQKHCEDLIWQFRAHSKTQQQVVWAFSIYVNNTMWKYKKYMLGLIVKSHCALVQNMNWIRLQTSLQSMMKRRSHRASEPRRLILKPAASDDKSIPEFMKSEYRTVASYGLNTTQ